MTNTSESGRVASESPREKAECDRCGDPIGAISNLAYVETADGASMQHSWCADDTLQEREGSDV